MNKPVNPLVAFIVIVVFGGLLGLYAWSSIQLTKLDHFGLAKSLGDNQLAFQFGKRLIFTDTEGTIKSEINLDKFQQKNFIGDFARFSNGDILLALHQSQDLITKLEVFKRKENLDQSSSDQSIYRCSSTGDNCKKFSNDLPIINRSFRLFIDADDQVFMSDSGRHKVLLLNKDGKLLASRGGFRFPNDLEIVGSDLVVADTNHHALKFLNPAVEKFGETQSEITIFMPLRGIWATDSPFTKALSRTGIWPVNTPYRWPIFFEHVNDDWWIMVGNNNLAYARVGIYSKSGELLRELDLPKGSDPIAMFQSVGTTMIVDVEQYNIYRYDQNGQRLPDFEIPALKKEMAGLRGQDRRLRNYEKLAIVFFVIFLAIGFGIAISMHLADVKEAEKKRQEDASKINTAKDVWLNPRKTLARELLLLQIMFFVMAACGCVVIFLLQHKYSPIFAGGFVILATLSVIISGFARKKIVAQRLGILQDKLVLEKGNKLWSAPYKDIYWSNNYIFCGDQIITLGRSNRSVIYEYHELNENLLPRLHAGNKLSDVVAALKCLRIQGPILGILIGLFITLKIGLAFVK